MLHFAALRPCIHAAHLEPCMVLRLAAPLLLPRVRLTRCSPVSHQHFSLLSFLPWSKVVGLMAASQPLSSPIPPPTASKTLGAKDGPLVWIDCE